MPVGTKPRVLQHKTQPALLLSLFDQKSIVLCLTVLQDFLGWILDPVLALCCLLLLVIQHPLQ